MKVPVRCVATKSGVRIETIAHVSGGSGSPLWIELIEIPLDELFDFATDFARARSETSGLLARRKP